MNPQLPEPLPDRLLDLLADQATVGLTSEEQTELDSLLAKYPEASADYFDSTVAAIQLCNLELPDTLPSALAGKLETDAARFFAPAVPSSVAQTPKPSGWMAWAGWVVAAGLLVGLVWTLWPKPPVPPVRDLTVAERRDQLRASGGKSFQAKNEANKPTGEVVWSQERQEGYIEVRGVPPNDPTKKQYQLWIVDKGRQQPEPVDGGVFDVSSDGHALVPIRTPLVIREPTVFAVTEEPAGGVVVSEAGKRGEFVVAMTAGNP
jgi:Anti-sigma-K factor rskA